MVNTIKEDENIKVLPKQDVDIITQETEKVSKEFNLIKAGINYSNKVYVEKMLPVEEILKLDKQSLNMAEGTLNYLKKQSCSQFKKENIKIVEALINICNLSIKYHQTGKEIYYKKAEKWLYRIND